MFACRWRRAAMTESGVIEPPMGAQRKLEDRNLAVRPIQSLDNLANQARCAPNASPSKVTTFPQIRRGLALANPAAGSFLLAVGGFRPVLSRRRGLGSKKSLSPTCRQTGVVAGLLIGG